MKYVKWHRLRHCLTLFVAALLLAAGVMSAAAVSDSEQARTQEIAELIARHHVSGIGMDELDLTDIDSIYASLGDPYTQYMTPDEWAEFLDSLENNYTGIGVRIGTNEEGFYVNEVFAGTPAEQSGLLEGDYIVSVDGKEVSGITTDQLVSRITGPEGTEVELGIRRDDRELSIKLTRKQIHIPAVSGKLLDGGIGYLRIMNFSSDADDLFSEQVDAMLEQGMTSLVIDLRNNPGGLLDTAGRIAERFIESGNLILTRDREKTQAGYPLRGKNTLDAPVTILVNEYSASASEVLAGALQDYDIAVLIGQNTFGKGSVQSLYELKSGGVLKLTVQEYLTPLGKPVNQVGLKPDIPVYGDTPQLVTALQRAGDINIRLTHTSKGMTVNGAPVQDSFKIVREQGMTYVPSRVLAAVVEADIEWNGKDRSVVFRQAGKETAYAVNSEGIKLEKGVTYIALNRFQTQFPSFAWSDQGGTLTLIENGR